MNNHVYWVAQLNIREGKTAELKTLMTEMVTATEANEPGTLNYEWSFSPDNASCHLYERYADSAAALIHLDTFGKKFASRFLACMEPKKLLAYGQPDEKTRKALTAMGAVFMTPVGGFAR